jgi:nitrite reductase/ring-hydroxylating ferredoxin subunit
MWAQHAVVVRSRRHRMVAHPLYRDESERSKIDIVPAVRRSGRTPQKLTLPGACGTLVPESVRLEKVAFPAEGHSVRVMVNGTPVAVFRVGGSLYAIDAKCTHVGGPLDQGPLSGTQVTCPWHGSVFDVRDGKVVRGPAARPATVYRARIEADALILERD